MKRAMTLWLVLVLLCASIVTAAAGAIENETAVGSSVAATCAFLSSSLVALLDENQGVLLCASIVLVVAYICSRLFNTMARQHPVIDEQHARLAQEEGAVALDFAVKAEQHGKLALDRLGRGDRANAAIYFYWAAMAYQETGQPDKARDMKEASAAQCEEEGKRHKAQGNIEQAIYYYTGAAELYEQIEELSKADSMRGAVVRPWGGW